MVRLLRSEFTKNLLLFVILSCSYAFSAFASAGPNQKIADKEYLIIGDTEGMIQGVQSYIDSGDLKLINGELHIVRPNTAVIFLGDLPDRGPYSIRLRKMMSALRKEDPSRFISIIGNRDGNKLNLFRDLPKITTRQDQNYVRFLEKSFETEHGVVLPKEAAARSVALTKQNTLERRLDFWLKEHSASDALEHHRKELEEIKGKNITSNEAARDYIDSLKPGGEHYQWIRDSEFVYSKPGEDFVAVHGGLTTGNYGHVPGDTHVYENPDDYAKKMHDWKEAWFKDYEKSFANKVRGKHLSGTMASFSDAIWDPEVINFETGRKGMLTFNERSPVYPYRSKAGGNFRALPREVSEKLKSYGKDAVYNGHSPSPNGPTVTNDGIVINVMADTSMSSLGKDVIIKHRVNEGLYTKWKTGDGTQVEYSLKPGSTTDIGKVTSDGYTVNGYTADKEVILSKYSETKRYAIEEKVVSPSELKHLNPNFVEGGVLDTSALEYLGNTQRALIEQKGIEFFTAKDVAKEVGNKHVVTVMSASKLGQLPRSEAELQLLAKKIVPKYIEKYGASNLVVFWGGTDVSKGEYPFVKLFQRYGVKDYGFVNEGIKFKDVGIAKNLVVAGKVEDWVTAIKTAVEITASKNGEVIAMGGGGIVKEVLEEAQKLNVPIHALSANPSFLAEGMTGGASAELAKNHPNYAFGNESELKNRIDLIANVNQLSKKQLKIGIYTGSFDPPHLGHLNVAKGMKESQGLDIVYVDAERNLKYKPGMQSLEKRRELLQALLKDEPNIRLLTPEMERKIGSGEMWDVLKAVKDENPTAKIFNIMGTDTLEWYKSLPKKVRPGGVTILVNNRDPLANIPANLDGAPVIRVDLKDDGISSTSIRRKIAQGEATPELPEAVRSIIDREQMYSTKLNKNPIAISKEDLIHKVSLTSLEKQLFVKDAPVLGYKIRSKKFNDIPLEIRKYMGAVDKTKYTAKYLEENIGSVIALQLDGDKPDFYVVGKSTYESKYVSVQMSDVIKKNEKYFNKLKASIPKTLSNESPEILAMLKTNPTEMIKMSSVGYPIDKEVVIDSPWGHQTKASGRDGFLVWDEGKNQYYMINQGADGNPLSYISKGSHASGSKITIKQESACPTRTELLLKIVGKIKHQ